MEAFNLLKQACWTKEFIKFSDLAVGEYPITEFALTETRFGPTVRVVIGEKFVYLPKRFSKDMTHEKIATLNTVPQILIFKGIDHSRHNM